MADKTATNNSEVVKMNNLLPNDDRWRFRIGVLHTLKMVWGYLQLFIVQKENQWCLESQITLIK